MKRMGHLVQADIDRPDVQARFWMDSCGGADPAAMALLQGGWAAPGAPVPALLAGWCARLAPVVVDLGAGTGFHSLLAAATGARRVHAVEPDAILREVLLANVASSERQAEIAISASAPLPAGEGLPTDAGPVLLRVGTGGHAMVAQLGASPMRALPVVVVEPPRAGDAASVSPPWRNDAYRAFLAAERGLLPLAESATGMLAAATVFLPVRDEEGWLAAAR